jgi:hypothetical protein
VSRFHLLPANLGPLAELAAGEARRHSLTGVRVTLSEGGRYRAEATDGRHLAVITGAGASADEYPTLPALESAPNGGCGAIVGARGWKAAFKPVARPSKNARARPILQNVAVVVGKDVTTLASTDLDGTHVAQPRNLDGRFPDVDFFLADLNGKPVRASVRVNAAKLVELLKVALAVADDDTALVTIELRGEKDPLSVRCENKGQTFEGVLMPLT